MFQKQIISKESSRCCRTLCMMKYKAKQNNHTLPKTFHIINDLIIVRISLHIISILVDLIIKLD